MAEGEEQPITNVDITDSMHYSRKPNIQRIVSKGYLVWGVGDVDGVPEFFRQEIPLDGEGEHDEIEDEATDGELFEVYWQKTKT